MPGKAGRPGNFGGGLQLKPCAHGLSPRRCGGECSKLYWREAAAKFRDERRERSRLRYWLKSRFDPIVAERKRINGMHCQRLRRTLTVYKPEIPQIYLLPNEVSP